MGNAPLGLSPWFDPTQWTGTDLAWLGLVVPLLLAAIGLAARAVRARRNARPHFVFDRLTLFGPNERPRSHYPFAIHFFVRNTGPGTAFGASATFLDSEDEPELFAEVYTQPAVMPGEPMDDFLGVRATRQKVDPTPEQARAFLERGIFVITCWDRFGRSYFFFPFGGGRVRGLPWANPTEFARFISKFPSRGALPSSLGMGRLRGDADTE
jgi:hypothetical protein